MIECNLSALALNSSNALVVKGIEVKIGQIWLIAGSPYLVEEVYPTYLAATCGVEWHKGELEVEDVELLQYTPSTLQAPITSEIIMPTVTFKLSNEQGVVEVIVNSYSLDIVGLNLSGAWSSDEIISLISRSIEFV